MDYSLAISFSKAEYEMLVLAARERGMSVELWAYNALRFAGLREMSWADPDRLVIPLQPGEKSFDEKHQAAAIAWYRGRKEAGLWVAPEGERLLRSYPE